MMNSQFSISAFLLSLREQGISLRVEGERLVCTAPKGMLNPDLRAVIRQHKVEILTLLRAAERLDVSPTAKLTPAAITRRRDTKSAPLSFAQQRLWFLQQLEPESSAYNMTQTLRLQGPLNFKALQQAFAIILERHESLRTHFVATDSVPLQVITLPEKFELPLIDLSTPTPQPSEVKLKILLDQNARRPFDLTADLMLRTTLIRLSEEEHVLQIIMHHIASDGWSMGVFTRELSALYQAYCHGQANPLPELPIQYADFAAWQRQWLSGEMLEAQLSYWQQHLSGASPLLELPTDRPRPPQPSYRGARLTFQVSQSLTDGLKHLSQQTGATLFMTLLAAFNTLLYRYTQQEDIVVGSPIANRNRVELEGLIGFFVNTLALRTDLSGNPSFRELLERVCQVALDAYAHQDVPFEKLVEELQPERSLSHSPLFQVMFVLQNAPRSAQRLAGLRLQPEPVENTTAKFDLTLSMSETAEGLRGSLEYSTDLFEAATIERMVGHFQTLLEGIVANPEQSIATLPILTAAERQQLLVKWNETRTDYPKDQCIHQLFEAQVERTPDAIAVVFEDQQLTYRELNARANQLAHYLQSLGVGPEVLVGICVERSLEMVVGLLGILKAGGAYVPLDPTYPQERLTFMLDDAQVTVLLTQQALLKKLPPHSAHVVCLGSAWEIIHLEDESNPSHATTANNLAYVIYTSGSTGVPKGVMISHRAICNHMLWMRSTFPLTSADAVLQKTPISFDASVWEFYAPLFTGARLVMAEPGGHKDSAYLVKVIRKQQITVLQLVPSLLQLLLKEPMVSTCTNLKHVFCGGEALHGELLAAFFQCLPTATLHNLYGPTEATIDVMIWTCKRDGDPTVIPIGKAISNTQLYVLDAHLNPLPVGVPGELHIGGEGLARGYLNRPDLTIEKFIPNPFNPEIDDRLYKSGDLVRYLPDGNIEFLGRIDHQVKIRGFRIELGEIESVLSQHPLVQQCVVMAREDEPGDKRLVAYVVSPEPEAPPIHDLRQFLQQTLPDYMIPSAFVQLESLPLTPNGKVDRQALPKPEASDIQAAAIYVAPRNPLEQQLADIWAEVLQLKQVGIHDNFFELGGHSLLATQVITRIHTQCQIELPLRRLFEAPTIAQLAASLDPKGALSDDLRTTISQHKAEILAFVQTVKSTDLAPSSQAILPTPDVDYVPLSLPQQRLWLLDQIEGPNATYNMAQNLQLTGQLQITALQQALQEIVHRHGSLRTTIVSVEGIPRQVVLPKLTVALPVVDLQALPTDAQNAEVQRLAQAERKQPFNLASGPLIRATLLKLGEHSHVLLLTIHHIVSDGWSMGLLKQELSLLYTAFASGQPSPLPELPIQYTDFALWQRQWLQGPVLADQIAYWQTQLAGAPPLLALPTDYPRPPAQTSRGSTEPIYLSPELTSRLKALSQACGCTLFMTLLAAFSTLLYRYSGQDDILIGSPIANRRQPEVEPLIGLFLNTLVLRTKLQGNPTFRELLQQVRQVTLAAYAHQDVPFEQLLETLRPPRDASYSPWFQVMLILNNTPSESLILPELTVTPLTTQGETAKFDLTLALREQDQGVRGGFEYSTDLFEAATIGRMVEHFQTLLAGIVSSPDEPVAALPLMPAAKAGLIDEAKTLARLLADLEDLSEAEVEQLLCRESQP